MGLQDGASRHLGDLHPRRLEKEALALGAGFSFHLEMVDLPSGAWASSISITWELRNPDSQPHSRPTESQAAQVVGTALCCGGSDAPSGLRSSSLRGSWDGKSGLRSNAGFTVGGTRLSSAPTFRLYKGWLAVCTLPPAASIASPHSQTCLPSGWVSNLGS